MKRGRYELAGAPAAPADCLTVAQIAALEDIDESTIRVWIRSGRLRATVQPNARSRYLVRKDDYWELVEGERRT